MNRDDVIRMAREAGFDTDLPGFRDGSAIALKLAAAAYAAGAAAEREKVARWQIGSGYTTGHGDTIEDLLVELEWQVREAEREACARVCDKYTESGSDHEAGAALNIQDTIRARGQA